ncbi:hypothetical protein B0H12DRAFT_1264549 [Mycena haematopus]|nr:hypothetical protein B0H12DRAFT_1264549 [Mycena haematopus]
MYLPKHPIRVLITAATDFIGGTVLNFMLGREDLPTRTGRNHLSLVIDIANADHPRGCRAILAGLKTRHARTVIQSVLIRSSGTGALTDKARGTSASEKIYEDLDCDDIRAILRNYVHREGDSMISEASVEGYIRGYVVMPPLIYGRGTGPFSRTSVQIPALIRAALKLGHAIHVGPGLSMWNGVHVQDLIDLYFILIDEEIPRLRRTRMLLMHPKDFCATDTYSWKEVGKRLHARGIIATAEAQALSLSKEEEVLGEWSGFAYGSNSRSRTGKAYTLGWKPKHHTTALFDSIDGEYGAVLEEGKYEAPKVHIDEMNIVLGPYFRGWKTRSEGRTFFF